MSKKVCIIAYDFPPLNSGGCQRNLRFASYLPHHDVDPVVFSVSNYDPDTNVDTSLMSLTDDEVETSRSALRAPRFWERAAWGHYLGFTDYIGERWRVNLKKDIARYVAAHGRFELVQVSVPPFSLLPLAVEVSKEYKVPLVVDLRDPWSTCVLTPFASRLHYWYIKHYEGRLLSHAGAIVVPTPQVGAELVQQHPSLHGRVLCIPNGFSRDRAPELPNGIYQPNGKVKIGYAGSFYYNEYSHHLIVSPWYKKRPYQWFQYTPRIEDWTYRSPLYFLRSLRRLLDEHPEWEGRIRFAIAGNQPISIKRMVSQLNLNEVVEFAGFIPREQLTEFYASCSFLLMTSAKIEGAEDYCLAGKTCEYFESGKPVLAFCCHGRQKQVMEASGLSICFDPDDTAANARMLNDCFQKEVSLQPDKRFLSQFDPSRTVQDLAHCVKEAIGSDVK